MVKAYTFVPVAYADNNESVFFRNSFGKCSALIIYVITLGLFLNFFKLSAYLCSMVWVWAIMGVFGAC